MQVFYLLDVIGTMAFAVSGALTAMNKNWIRLAFLLLHSLRR